MTDEKEDTGFFSYQTERSRVKSTIVAKCFGAWATIMKGQYAKIAYLDLFSGPGIYADGTESTPLIILKKVASNPVLRDKVQIYFNDADQDYCNDLEAHCQKVPDYSRLKYKPEYNCGEINSGFIVALEKLSLIPTFCFIDPFGYKGLSLRLIKAITKNRGSEAVFFYNYNRMNAAIENPVLFATAADVLGDDLAAKLKPDLSGLSPAQREAVTLDAIAGRLQTFGNYVLPFTFKQTDKMKTSHHLIHVTKNVLGYKIMKDIMAKESSRIEDGVGSFEYCPADRHQSFLFPYCRTIEELEQDLLTRFAGRDISVVDVFQEHNVGTRYVLANYKTALLRLEQRAAIMATPPESKRRQIGGQPTMGERTLIKFPNI